MELDLLKLIIVKTINKLKDNLLTTIHPQPIPIGVSNRHVHLSKEDLEVLFGAGYELKLKQKISQTGQYAAVETVNLAGPKGCIEGVRILGPLRQHTQIEILRSDKYKLGVSPPLRESGDTKNSSEMTIVGPKGSVHIKEGMILPRRHVHMTPLDASVYGVADGDIVQVSAGSGRGLIFDQVVIRVREDFVLEFHIDMDEANAAEVENGDQARLLVIKGNPNLTSVAAGLGKRDTAKLKETEVLLLITEDNVRQAWKEKKPLFAGKGAMITPLAKDTMRELGVEVIDK